MRFTALVYVISVGLLSCSKSNSDITPTSCMDTQQYGKTVSQASQQLIGSWTLVASAGSEQSLPNQVVQFDTTGHCLITQNGQRFGPFSYSVNLTPSFKDRTLSTPQLTVSDSTQNLDLRRIGTGQLYICEQELVIDYGSHLDGSIRSYHRQ